MNFLSDTFKSAQSHGAKFDVTKALDYINRDLHSLESLVISVKNNNSDFIESVSNTATVSLTVDSLGNLTADFASLNISQFTNDSGYLTSATQYISSISDTATIDLDVTGGVLTATLLSLGSLTPTLAQVLAVGNITGGTDIVLSHSDVIQDPTANSVFDLSYAGTDGVGVWTSGATDLSKGFVSVQNGGVYAGWNWGVGNGSHIQITSSTYKLNNAALSHPLDICSEQFIRLLGNDDIFIDTQSGGEIKTTALTYFNLKFTAANPLGAVYDSDISANFADLSLVNKKWVVDNFASSTLTLAQVLSNGNIVNPGQYIKFDNDSENTYIVASGTGIGNFVSLQFFDTSWQLSSGNGGFKGLTYPIDISGNFDSTSVINKGYADATYSPLAGSTSIVTLGTITTGVWQGTAVANSYIATALSSKTYEGLTISSTTGTFTLTNGKTLSVSNTLTFTGTDGSSVAFGAGGTVIYTSNKLSALSSTTSAELAGVISDETGTDKLVFNTSPTLVTPLLGTPTSGTLTNCTGLPEAGLTLADNTTNNCSTSNHGFLKKLPNNASQFMDGTGAWDQPTLADISDYDNEVIKAYKALGSVILAQSVGTTAAHITGAQTQFQNQVVTFQAVWLPVAATITGVKWYQVTAGVYTANNYNGVGLYTYSGGTLTLVASSTDDGNIWKATSNTYSSKAFSGTYSASAGLYFVGALYCRSAVTTLPQIGGPTSAPNAAIPGIDFTNSAKLSANIGSQTSLPSTQAMSGLTGNTNGINTWFALY